MSTMIRLYSGGTNQIREVWDSILMKSGEEELDIGEEQFKHGRCSIKNILSCVCINICAPHFND